MNKQTALILMSLLLCGSVSGCKAKKSSLEPSSTISPTIPSSRESEDTTIPEVDTNIVTEQEYLEAFDNLFKLENATYELSIESGSVLKPGTSGIDSEKIIQKIDGNKLNFQSDYKIYQEITSEFFADYYSKNGATTDIEKKEAYDEFVSNLLNYGATIIEQDEDYLLVVMSGVYDDFYGEKIDGTFLLDYEVTDYDSHKFYQSKKFIDKSHSFQLENFDQFLSLFNNKDFYERLTYNKETGSYLADPTPYIGPLFEESFNLSEIKEANLTFAFSNKELSNISLSFKVDNGYAFETFSILDIGSTEVNLPNNVVTCDHESVANILGSSCDAYHYSYCKECDSVIDYEEHIYERDVCLKCGHIHEKNEREITLNVDDEHMRSHFHYCLSENGNLDEIRARGLFVDYYDTDKEAYVYSCSTNECDIRLEQTTITGVESGTPCLKHKHYNFVFYHGESEVPFETLNLDSWKVEHSFVITSSVNPDNPCQLLLESKCSVCGLTETSYSDCHNFSYSYTASGCSTILTFNCGVCGKQKTQEKSCHKLVNIGERIGSGYQCHCDECGQDFFGQYSFYSLGFQGHSISSYETGNMGVMPHVFDSKGCCKFCGYEKSDNGEEMIFLYSIFEGTEYIAFSKTTDDIYTVFYYSGFDVISDDDYKKCYKARYSDYSFTKEIIYDEFGFTVDYTILKGEEIILEFSI